MKVFSGKVLEYALHILLWGTGFILILLYVRTLGVFSREDGNLTIPVIYGLVSNLILFYGNALVLIPRLIPGKKHLSYVRSVLILFASVTLVESLIDYFLSTSIYSTEQESFSVVIILNTLINGLILSLSIGYGFIKNWIINENQKQKLEKEKLSAELK